MLCTVLHQCMQGTEIEGGKARHSILFHSMTILSYAHPLENKLPKKRFVPNIMDNIFVLVKLLKMYFDN